MSITSQEANALGVMSKIIPLLSNGAAGSLIYLQTSNLNSQYPVVLGINKPYLQDRADSRRPDVMKSLLPKPEEAVLREAWSIGRERSSSFSVLNLWDVSHFVVSWRAFVCFWFFYRSLLRGTKKYHLLFSFSL